MVVRDNLCRWHMMVDNKCGICGKDGGSQLHLFFKCEFARALWYACPLQLDTTTIMGTNFALCWAYLEEKYKTGA